MVTIAIGDIHGNLPALCDLFTRLRGELDEADTVVFLGDYIDRGPNSKGCIDLLLALRAERKAPVVCLRGNHEDWLLRTMVDYSRHSWLLGMEAFDTIRSYSPDAADALGKAVAACGAALFLERHELPCDMFFGHVPASHRAFLEQLVHYFRVPSGVCVHGRLDPRLPRLEEQTLEALLWGTGPSRRQRQKARKKVPRNRVVL
jgi:serine/threonine protein phosphatase 1